MKPPPSPAFYARKRRPSNLESDLVESSQANLLGLGKGGEYVGLHDAAISKGGYASSDSVSVGSGGMVDCNGHIYMSLNPSTTIDPGHIDVMARGKDGGGGGGGVVQEGREGEFIQQMLPTEESTPAQPPVALADFLKVLPAQLGAEQAAAVALLVAPTFSRSAATELVGMEGITVNGGGSDGDGGGGSVSRGSPAMGGGSTPLSSREVTGFMPDAWGVAGKTINVTNTVGDNDDDGTIAEVRRFYFLLRPFASRGGGKLTRVDIYETQKLPSSHFTASTFFSALSP